MPNQFHQSRARQLGLLYLLYFIFAVSGALLVKGLAVRGDGATTAHNFAAHIVLLRASSGMGLVSVALYLALTARFYELFRSVSRSLSLLATLLSVTACTIQAVGGILFVSLPVLLASQVGLETEGFDALVRSLWVIHTQAVYSSLVFFGIFDLLIGILILRSCFLPRILGVLMTLAGLAWMTYLWPPFGNGLSQVVQPLGFLAEAILMIWLLARGVDEGRWVTLANSKAI